MNTKKDIFQKHKDQNPKPRSPMNSQHTHNALTNQKSSAAYFKDVKTEDAFSNHDQKLVETTYLWRQLSSDKNHHSANPLLQRSLSQQNRWMEQQWTYQDFFTIHTQSWKMKNLYHKKSHQGWTQKKDIFSSTKTKIKTQNSHETSAYPHRINNQKKRRCVFQRCQNWRNIQ